MKIKKQRLYSSNVADDVFYNKEYDVSKIEKAVVIVNGFPDFPGPSALTTCFAEENTIVFQPHIEGTFDSSGFFSPSGVKNTFVLIKSMLENSLASIEPNGEQIHQSWSFSKLYLVGHSFGGILILRYFSHLASHLNGVLFTSPALHYATKYGCNEIGHEHYESVRSKYPFTYRLAPIEAWHGILNGNDVVPESTMGTAEKLQIIYGSDDKYFDISIVKSTALPLAERYINANFAKIDIIQGAGHSSSELLKKDITMQLIKKFLN